MILSISKIKHQPGLSQKFDISAVIPREVAADFADISVTGLVEFRGSVSNAGDGLFRLEGEYSAQVGYSCCRCLKPCSKKVSGNIEALFGDSSAAALEDEIDIRQLDGDNICPADLIMSDIAFDFPMQPLCREDCKGICPICGADLNNQACSCAGEKIDPRWEKLKDFKFTPDK